MVSELQHFSKTPASSTLNDICMVSIQIYITIFNTFASHWKTKSKILLCGMMLPPPCFTVLHCVFGWYADIFFAPNISFRIKMWEVVVTCREWTVLTQFSCMSFNVTHLGDVTVVLHSLYLFMMAFMVHLMFWKFL